MVPPQHGNRYPRFPSNLSLAILGLGCHRLGHWTLKLQYGEGRDESGVGGGGWGGGVYLHKRVAGGRNGFVGDGIRALHICIYIYIYIKRNISKFGGGGGEVGKDVPSPTNEPRSQTSLQRALGLTRRGSQGLRTPPL